MLKQQQSRCSKSSQGMKPATQPSFVFNRLFLPWGTGGFGGGHSKKGRTYITGLSYLVAIIKAFSALCREPEIKISLGCRRRCHEKSIVARSLKNLVYVIAMTFVAFTFVTEMRTCAGFEDTVLPLKFQQSRIAFENLQILSNIWWMPNSVR